MKIRKKVYDSLLLQTPLLPPETGGILGSQKGIITKVCFDEGNNSHSVPSIYKPNIEKLNQIIANWSEWTIEFCGVFHTHYPHDPTLSPADKKYIEQIMRAMPTRVRALYFPIVLPRNTIIGYRASRCESEIYIACEKIEILLNGGN